MAVDEGNSVAFCAVVGWDVVTAACAADDVDNDVVVDTIVEVGKTV